MMRSWATHFDVRVLFCFSFFSVNHLNVFSYRSVMCYGFELIVCFKRSVSFFVSFKQPLWPALDGTCLKVFVNAVETFVIHVLRPRIGAQLVFFYTEEDKTNPQQRETSECSLMLCAAGLCCWLLRLLLAAAAGCCCRVRAPGFWLLAAAAG